MQWRDREGVETAAIAALVPIGGKRVLDVGCGPGRMTAFAVEAGAASLYAFDPNSESVAQARAALPPKLRRRVRFGVHGAKELDLPRRRFDVALCGWSL